ncbi:MAG: hypothetical protein WD004_03795 [Actinomycetota bacterium]
MAKKRKRTQRRPARSGNGHRPGDAPAHTEPEAEAVPRHPGATVFPPVYRSLLTGFETAAGNPVMLLVPLVLVLVVWMALVAAGLSFFPFEMPSVLALTPIGSSFDGAISTTLLGMSLWTLAAILLFTMLRSLVVAVFIGMMDEVMDFGHVTGVGPLRGLRSFLPVLTYEYIGVLITLFGSIFVQMLGAGAGPILRIALPVAVIFFLTFMPIVAVRKGIRARDALSRSIRGARLPGWIRHLVLSMAYYFVATLGQDFLTPDRYVITATPGFRTWVFVLGATLFNMVFLGAFIAEWRAIESYVPAKAPRRAPAPRRR